METQSETDTTSANENIPDPLVELDTTEVQPNESNVPEEEIILSECEQDTNQINVPRRSQSGSKKVHVPRVGKSFSYNHSVLIQRFEFGLHKLTHRAS